MMRRLLAATLVALLPLTALADCEPVDGIASICGLQAPEDIEWVTGTYFLVFSQMGHGGGVSLLDTRDDSVRELYPGGAEAREPGWGDSRCEKPPGAAIEAHGIHLHRRKDGRLLLLVVNHGGRESVEFFELREPVQDVPVAVWRGCVEAVDDLYFNDVVALPDGGFLATHMLPRDTPLWGAVKTLFGSRAGKVYRWRPESGFEPVPGTEVQFANGIAIAPDDSHFYLNAYLGNTVSKFPLAGGEPVAIAAVSRPDNSAWDSRGRLLVASHSDAPLALLDGIPNDDGSPVDLAFRIVALDPETLEQEVLLEREGPPMGGGTVAVEAAGYLYIGSYAGDRIIKFPLTIDR